MHSASQPNMESFNDRAQEMVTEESEFQIWKYYQSQGFFPAFWKPNTGSRDAVGNKLFKAVRRES